MNPTYLKLAFAVLSLVGIFVFPKYELLFLGMFATFVVILLMEFEI